MSLEGGGIILVAPVAAATAVAAAAAAGAVFVGGVCVVQAGRGMVSVAQAVDEAIRARAARQEAINQQCAAYEKMMRNAARSPGLTGGARMQAELMERLRARKRFANRPLPTSPSVVPNTQIDVGKANLDEELPAFEIHDHSSLRQWRGLAQQLREEINKRLTRLDTQNWEGLLAVDDLRAELSDLGKSWDTEDTNYNRVLQRLRAVDAEITQRVNHARDRHSDREEAADALAAAGNQLSAKLDTMGHEPEMQVALSVGQDLLERADGFFAAGDFAGARSWADTAESYLNNLSDSLEEMRRTNMEVAIAQLESYVDDFDFPDDVDFTAPNAVSRQLTRARRHLAEGDLEACWGVLQDAQDAAEDLADLVAARSKARYRDKAVEIASNVLKSMGYEVTQLSVSEKGREDARRILATRDNGAQFQFTISADGLLRYKAEGFGDLECQREANTFFRKLEEERMEVNVQSEISATSVAERLREVLLRQGYAMVEERIESHGVILTASTLDEPDKKIEVDADGVPHSLSDELFSSQQALPGKEFSGSREVEIQRAADEDYWRQWRQRVESRRVRV